MNVEGKNVFVDFLALLGVRYTESFLNQTFNEHPHKYNLYGLSKMLSDYRISNAATRIENKENDLFNIVCPFVAHFGGEFVAVYKVETDKVHYLRNGSKLSISVADFIKSWSGIILLAETSSESSEPDYYEHRKKELLNLAQKSVLWLAGLFILALVYIHGKTYTNLGTSLLIFVNLTSIFVCYLLVLKQLNIQSRYVDKICTLFSQSDCNNVLESDAAKLFGIFGWSEIGLGYFTANLFILLLLPHLMPWLTIINMLALPYSFWSAWYQKVKARQWCPLCLIVQILLWTIFILNLTFGYVNSAADFFLNIQSINYSQFIIVICVYVIPVFALNLLLPKLSEGNQVTQLRQEINSIKANEELFKTLLMQQPVYEVSKADSQILFGNPDAKLKISILTNPFCNPCAKMHASASSISKCNFSGDATGLFF